MLNSNQALFLMIVGAAAGFACARGVLTADFPRLRGSEATAAPADAGPRADVVALVLDDTRITAMVEAGLANEFGMAARAFRVATEGSVVTLSGNVDTMLEHDIALQVASDTVGVRRVVDAVTVRNAAGADLWQGPRARRSFEDTI